MSPLRRPRLGSNVVIRLVLAAGLALPAAASAAPAVAQATAPHGPTHRPVENRPAGPHVSRTDSRPVVRPAPVVKPDAARNAAGGLAPTPPMGFNNWNSTRCRAEFNEGLVKATADYFVSSGLKDAGYQYVNIDDCWALPERNADGNLVPDPARFPNGIKAVADYIHERGLKFGIYTSAGTKTCDDLGFPGGLDHEQQDANLFASWGVDYLKYDNCNNQGRDAIERYKKMSEALKATGRPIVLSICEWGSSDPKVWTWGRDYGQLWRTTGDIFDFWNSLRGIITQNLPLAEYAGPNGFNDPDMLEIGNGGMTDTEYRTQFSMWAVMAAPLFIGTDLRKVTPQTMKILLNKDAIAVDQDPLGVQGTDIWQLNGKHVVVKPLAGGDRAVALYNETDQPAVISTTVEAIGLSGASAYRVRDLWQHTNRHTAGRLGATVPAHGTVLLRVGPDPKATRYAPMVTLSISPQPGTPAAIVVPGKANTLTTTVTNEGVAPAKAVQVNIRTPEGWLLRNKTGRSTSSVPAGMPYTTTWQLYPPADAVPGTYPLTADVSYLPADAGFPATAGAATAVMVTPPAPTGTAYLGDLPWVSADNFWGPVERNGSNGEQGGNDGHPLTIAGTVYEKGLGAHAPSSIVYYTGGKCASLDAVVGVDDEVGSHGAVAFKVLADDKVAADSGVLTGDSSAYPLKADITGATMVTLVATDGGDGPGWDHADWANLTVLCAAR